MKATAAKAKGTGRDSRTVSANIPVVMSIAGSDSGGGAGIQADLKTFDCLGVFGTSAITCVTAQTPDRVTGIGVIEPNIVSLQIRTVCEGFPVAAAKTGMLFSPPVIKAVARTLAKVNIPILVVDPVMVATSGSRLLQEKSVALLCGELIPKATVITPNLPEAETLCGRAIHSLDELKAAAREIGDRFSVACVAKGGHIGGVEVTDILYDHGHMTVFSAPRVRVLETHGTGCVFSAALTAFLAQQRPLVEAVRLAKAFVTSSLERAMRVGRHRPLGIHAAAASSQRVRVKN